MSYMFNGDGKKTWNCVHVNALYDLVSGMYVDALIQPGKKHPRQLNSTYAMKLCREYFRNKIGPSDLKALMLRSVMPIRPNRHFERKLNKKQPRTFNYRIS